MPAVPPNTPQLDERAHAAKEKMDQLANQLDDLFVEPLALPNKKTKSSGPRTKEQNEYLVLNHLQNNNQQANRFRIPAIHP